MTPIIGVIASSVSKANFAYQLGGYTTSAQSSINRLNMTSDTVSTISNTLPKIVYAYWASGSTNDKVAGYAFQGIRNSVSSNEIFKFVFNGETASTLSATCTTNAYYSAAFTNPKVAAYTGGSIPSAGTSNNLDKLSFSTETKTNLSALNANRESAAGGQSATTGYIIGGQASLFNDVTKIPFSTETSSTLADVLTTNYNYHSCITNLGSAIYVVGADNGTTTVNKFLPSNETSSAISATLPSRQDNSVAVNGSAAGYTMGGYAVGTGNISRILKLLFSNETITTLSAALSTARSDGAGVMNY